MELDYFLFPFFTSFYWLNGFAIYVMCIIVRLCIINGQRGKTIWETLNSEVASQGPIDKQGTSS